MEQSQPHRPLPSYGFAGEDAGIGDDACRSASFARVMQQATRFANDGHAPILIEGEAGTGKTRLARIIHDLSPRAASTFNSVTLSTLDDSLASSALFGHVAGAFTDARHARSGHFATAKGGTLFLDEIGKASLAVQQKLLQAVEYGEIRPVGSDRELRVDVRVVAATNVPLSELVARERFLPDLEARLSNFRIRLPALRDRRADIPLLVRDAIRRHATARGYESPPAIDAELMAALQRAPWPNNIRQLDSTMHRLLVDAEGAPVLTLDHCLDDLAYLRDVKMTTPSNLTPGRVSDALERASSLTDAARLLGVDRTTLYRFRRRNHTTTDA